MSRSRAPYAFGCVGLIVAALTAPWACIPHPEQDFEDYQERIASFPKPVIEASVIDTGPPPTKAVEGIYYGACLSELAFGQPDNVFNFYTTTKFTPGPNGGPGKLELTIQPLKVFNKKPPATVTLADKVGGAIVATPADVSAAGKYTINLGTVTVPGEANPISGSNVLIENGSLQGNFAEARFCARLGGEVKQPVAAARTLDTSQNICQFVAVKEGDTRPALTASDFQAATCPVD
jgi:hypothetical protein